MHRRFIALVFMIAVAPLQTAEPAKPNTLTAKEIADGWLLLFDGESTFGWKVAVDAKVNDGVLEFVGEKAPIQSAVFTSIVGSHELVFEYRVTGKPARFWLDVGLGGPALDLKPTEEPGWCRVTERADFNSKQHELTGTSTNHSAAGKDLGGGDFKFRPVLGRNRLVFQVPLGSTLSLRSIKLRPLGLQSIFNGTDLTGWKEHPGKKSKFSVENGTIRIQNGPGDLQSEGQWDDFILQLECKTNGNRLNSGVFFRCRPGEYQQGYEAQIHNGFNGQLPKEYTIEEFDPKTNKPLGKKKVKYDAVDYGTGAIYRRVPARKQMAKDNEWFTMTVIAAGRHIATWVNGVQMVDWTDNRPLADNGRNGCRLEKGPISFQGHDPTTDLSFRNIRIGELKN